MLESPKVEKVWNKRRNWTSNCEINQADEPLGSTSTDSLTF